MKQFALALSLLLASRAASAQQAPAAPVRPPVDSATQRIAYAGIVAVPGAAGTELYARGQLWFATAFYAAHSVVLVSDPPAGFLLGQVFAYTDLSDGFLPLPIQVRVWCTIKLSFQEGRYRYQLTDFYFSQDPAVHSRPSQLPRGSVEQVCLARRADGTPTRQATEFSHRLDQVAQQLIASLRAGMSQPAAGGAW